MESSKIATKLLNELEIQSDNGMKPIKQVWYSVQETAKSLGIKRESVRIVLDKMIEIGVIKVRSSDPALYEFTKRGKRIGRAELEKLF